jgi:ribonuclease HII
MNDQELEGLKEKLKDKIILGMDEVGRGCLAGPLVVGCVVLNGDTFIDGLNDSKKLTKKKRETILKSIKREAKDCSLYYISAKKIDEFGISKSLELAYSLALSEINVIPDFILIDGNINFLKNVINKDVRKISLDLDVKRFENVPIITIIKGDGKISAISAASILAKQSRDHYMELVSDIYPEYGFSDHVGYGTKKHLDAIKEKGILDIHRRSFRPISEMLKN